MKQGKIIVLLAIAMIAACSGQAPASSTQNTDASEVIQAGMNIDRPTTPTSAVPQLDAEGDDVSSDSGLFRSSFDECVTNSEGVTFDTQACIESEFNFHDARLQAAYQKQQLSLQGGALEALKQAQAAWLAEREKECGWDSMHEGQGQRLDANYCNLRRTAKRANDLEKH